MVKPIEENDDVGTMTKPGFVYAFSMNWRDGHQSLTLTVAEARKLLELLPGAIERAEHPEACPDTWR